MTASSRLRYLPLTLGTGVSLLLLTAAARPLASNPVPGIGIVVKKNRPPGSSARVAVTDANGQFTLPLEIGSHTITLPAADVRAAVARIANQAAATRRAGAARPAEVRDEDLSLTLRETTGLRVTPCTATGYADVALVTVTTAGAVLTGGLAWDDAAPVADGAARGAPRIVALRDGAAVALRGPVAAAESPRTATGTTVGGRVPAAVPPPAPSGAAVRRAAAAVRTPCDAAR